MISQGKRAAAESPALLSKAARRKYGCWKRESSRYRLQAGQLRSFSDIAITNTTSAITSTTTTAAITFTTTSTAAATTDTNTTGDPNITGFSHKCGCLCGLLGIKPLIFANTWLF